MGPDGDERIGVRIARSGIESSQRLDRRRWVIERTKGPLRRCPDSRDMLTVPAKAEGPRAPSLIRG